MTTEWKVGDRVVSKGGLGVDAGELGTVCDTTSHPFSHVGVRWDKPNPKYHDCMGSCEGEYGWYMLFEYITKLEETEVDTNNPLYNFRAHEELGEDAWGGLSKAVRDIVWSVGGEGEYAWKHVAPTLSNGSWSIRKARSFLSPARGVRLRVLLRTLWSMG